MKLLAAILSILFLAITASQAAEFDYRDNKIYLYGFIEEGDFENKFLPLASEHLGKLEAVYLYSPGGIVNDSLRIGIYIRIHDIDTVAYSDCYSACSYIWLAGKTRYVDKTVDTYILIHPPYTFQWNMFWIIPTPKDSELMENLTDYLSLMGLSFNAITEIVNTPTGPYHEDEAIMIGPDKAREWKLDVKMYPED